MSDYLQSTFSAGSTTALTSFTNDDASTWAAWGSGNTGGAPNVYSSYTGICAPGAQGFHCYRSSVISSTADTAISGEFIYVSSDFDSAGVALRLNSSQTAGYIAVYRVTPGKWQIYSLTGAFSATLICESSAVSYSGTTTLSYEFGVSGTGASTSLYLKINGTTVCSGTDTAGAAPDAGYAGVWFNNYGAVNPDSGMFVGSMAAADSGGSFAITSPVDGVVRQLSGGATGTAQIVLSGTYSGTAPNQWRLVYYDTGAVVSGFDWQAFSAAPSGGTFSQTITSVPKSSWWYKVQVRDSGSPAVIVSSGRVGAGVLVVVDGQSQAWLFFSSTAWAGDGSLVPDGRLRITGIQPTGWDVPDPATMNGAVALGNDLIDALRCPVALIDGSWDASGLTVVGNGGIWINGGTAGNAYTASAAAVTAAGGAAAATIWLQGEGDAGSSVSQSAYYTALGQLIGLRRTDIGNASHPYVVVTLGNYTAGGISDSQWEAIKLAQVQKCDDAYVYRVDRMDLSLHSDGVHLTADGFRTLGRRCARAVLAALGVGARYRGPSYSKVNKINSTTFDVLLDFDLGADVIQLTGITGFRVLDGSTPITISSVSHTAGTRTIQLVLSSAPSALPTVQYLYGITPTISGIATDDSMLQLPLEYNAGIQARDIPTATITLVNASGTAQASLSGLKWAWFDDATAQTLSSPTDVGTTETTDGSGVLTVELPNTSLASSGVGCLFVTNSDGTTTQSPANKAFCGPVAVT